MDFDLQGAIEDNYGPLFEGDLSDLTDYEDYERPASGWTSSGEDEKPFSDYEEHPWDSETESDIGRSEGFEERGGTGTGVSSKDDLLSICDCSVRYLD